MNETGHDDGDPGPTDPGSPDDTGAGDQQSRRGTNGGRARAKNSRLDVMADLRSEAALIGCVLTNAACFDDVCDRVTDRDFGSFAHGAVWRAIVACDGAGKPFDPVTVADELRRSGEVGKTDPHKIVAGIVSDAGDAANAIHYADIVHDIGTRRRLLDAAREIGTAACAPESSADDVLELAETSVFAIAHSDVASGFVTAADAVGHAMEQIARGSGAALTGASTGLADLDTITGGLAGGQLIVVAARPAMGKTSFALSVGRHICETTDKIAAVASYEMGHEELAMRLLATASAVPANRLKRGNLPTHVSRTVSEQGKRLAALPLLIDDQPPSTISGLRSAIRRTARRGPIGVIVVDYIQLMSGDARRTNASRNDEVGEISRGLKVLSREVDAPIIALSQLSRAVEQRPNKRPQLSDLRDSGCLTRDMRLFRADTGAAVTFGELLDTNATDVPVWATNADGKVVEANLTHAFPSGTKETFKVTLASGAVVEATGNHPFRVVDGWTALEDLVPGARVATVRALPGPRTPVPMDEDEIVLLAHLLRAGTLVDTQTVRYTSADEADLAAVESAALHRFGIAARRVPGVCSAGTTHLHLSACEPVASERHNPVVEWSATHGLWGKRAWDKRVPRAVFSLPNEQVELFLQHLSGTAGSCTSEPGRRTEHQTGGVGYSTASAKLAQDVRVLLLRIGVQACVREHEDPRGSTMYTVGTAGSSQRTCLGRVARHGQDDADLEAGSANDLFWDRIVAIDSIGTRDVYDATVDDVHNFICEGLVLHNSIEQDADAVIFLYRDAVYNENADPRAGEIIVAKQRSGPTGIVNATFDGNLTRWSDAGTPAPTLTLDGDDDRAAAAARYTQNPGGARPARRNGPPERTYDPAAGDPF